MFPTDGKLERMRPPPSAPTQAAISHGGTVAPGLVGRPRLDQSAGDQSAWPESLYPGLGCVASVGPLRDGVRNDPLAALLTRLTSTVEPPDNPSL